MLKNDILHTKKVQHFKINDYVILNHYSGTTPLYILNLNSDSRKESIVFLKNDGKDFFKIYNYKRYKLFQDKFTPVGIGAYVYKILFKKLKKLNIIVFYYYEGLVSARTKEASIRLYWLSFDKDLTKFIFSRGPLVWSFKKTDNNFSIFQKQFDVSFIDKNIDGLMDIFIRSGNLSYTFLQGSKLKFIQNLK